MPWNQNTLTDTIVPSAARTTSGSQESVENFGVIEDARFQLDVTAVSGTTPTLDVVMETTVDGTNWDTIGTFTQRTAAGRQVVTVNNVIGEKVRARWTIGGATPSFTFSVKAVAER